MQDIHIFNGFPQGYLKEKVATKNLLSKRGDETIYHHGKKGQNHRSPVLPRDRKRVRLAPGRRHHADGDLGRVVPAREAGARIAADGTDAYNEWRIVSGS